MAKKATVTPVVHKKTFKSQIDIYLNCDLPQDSMKLLVEWLNKTSHDVRIVANSLVANPGVAETKWCVANAEGIVFRDYVIPVVPKTQIDTLAKFVSALHKSVVQDEGESVITPSFGKPSKKDSGYFQSIIAWKTRVLGNIFTGHTHAEKHLGLAAFPSKFFKVWHPIFESKTEKDVLMLVKVAGNELPLESVTIDALYVPYTISKAWNSFFSGISFAFSFWWKWFVKLPLSAKDPEAQKPFVSNPNHPWWRMAFFVTLIVSLVTFVGISRQYNLTWDEPGLNEHSKDIVNFYTSMGADTSIYNFQKTDYQVLLYYGSSVDTISSVLYQIFGWGEFETRHAVIALFGFLLLLFTGLCAGYLGGWRSGVIALLFVLFSPSLFGHFFNNPKDVPFAAGYIMAIYYLIRLLLEMPKPKTQTIFMLAVGIGIAISARAGGILLIAFTVMFLGIHWLLGKENKIQSFKKYFVLLMKILIPGYLLGIVLWPYALTHPIKGVLTALSEFEKFSFLTYYELFEGVRIYEKPWYYIFKSIAITAPLFVLAGVTFYLLVSMFQKDKKGGWLVVGLLVFVTAFPVLYAAYKKSYVYNGWRHFLFVYPTIVVMAVMGWEYISKLLGKSPLRVVIPFVAIGWTSITAIWSFKNHPYQYMYYNELVGGVKGAHGNYEIDYWNQMSRNAYKWLLENELKPSKELVQINSNNIPQSLEYYNRDKFITLSKAETGVVYCLVDMPYYPYSVKQSLKERGFAGAPGYIGTPIRIKTVSPAGVKAIIEGTNTEVNFTSEESNMFLVSTYRVVWTREYEWTESAWDYAIWTSRTLCKNQIKNGAWPPKGTIKTIDIDGEPIIAIVKRLSKEDFEAHNFRKKNRPDTAIVLYKKAFAKNPFEEEVARGLAESYKMVKQYDSAIRYFQIAATIRDGNYLAFAGLGETYLAKSSDYQQGSSDYNASLSKAEEFFMLAYKFKSNYTSALFYIGNINLARNNFGVAREYYQKTIDNNPGFAYGYVGLGKSLLGMNQNNEAIQYFYTAVQIDPNQTEAIYYLWQTFEKVGQPEQAERFKQAYLKIIGNSGIGM